MFKTLSELKMILLPNMTKYPYLVKICSLIDIGMKKLSTLLDVEIVNLL